MSEKANDAEMSLGSPYAFQLGKLIWGDREEKEQFVQTYGYEHALSRIDSAIQSMQEPAKGYEKEHEEWYRDIMDFKKDLLSRQGY